jgi:hypothetical protein
MDNLDTGSLQNVEHLRGENFAFVNHDVTEYLDVDGEVDFVYHLAALASPIDYLRMPLHSLKVGSYGTHHALGLAKWKREGFFWRMREKYVIRDFHPLVFFYALGFLMTLLGLGLGIAQVVLRIMGNAVSVGAVVLVALLLIFGLQFTLFAMWFDMESNKDLR